MAMSASLGSAFSAFCCSAGRRGPLYLARPKLLGKLDMSWADTFLGILKDNDVRLISYVPDNAGKGQTPRDPALIRSRFMKGLGTGRSAGVET